MSMSNTGNAQGVDLTISLCLTYTLCIVCIRLWIRKGSYGLDDLVVFITTVFVIGHTASDYVALVTGLGKPWEDIVAAQDLSSLNAASIAGIVIWTFAMYLSKMCVLAFLYRITKKPEQIKLYHGCTVLMATLGLASVLTVNANCYAGSGFYWAFPDNTRSCPSQRIRWQILTAFDIVTELAVLALPVQLVWNLQMPLRKKAIVLTAFFLRAPVTGLSLLRNYFTLGLSDSSSDSGEDAALVVICMEIELAYALACCTLSALKGFTENFNSGFGQGFTRARGEPHYNMSDLSKVSGASSRAERAKGADNIETTSKTVHDLPGNDRFVTWPDPRGPPPMLRPDSDRIHSATSVTSEPGRIFRPGDRGRNGSIDDLVIHRETQLMVQLDVAR